ncbi:amylopectin binding [Nakaseomyces bracarensis]|uniref:Amylopectin binding n=1 Tax=Nakaseomyces bracarensis TaxID=273131 RepID=A0ABR4NUX0_9SACH
MVETVFIWRVKEGEETPNEVIVTGDFDGWQSKHKLEYNETANEFHVHVPVDFSSNDKVFFKFVVDGQWMTSDAYKTESNEMGTTNNYITQSDIGADVLVNETDSEVKGTGEQKRRFKIKRVVRTNKKTGERVVVSQEVVPLDAEGNPITESMENSVEPSPVMDKEEEKMENDMNEEEEMKEEMKQETMGGETKQAEMKKKPVVANQNRPKKTPAKGTPAQTKANETGFMKKVKKFFAPR